VFGFDFGGIVFVEHRRLPENYWRKGRIIVEADGFQVA